MQETETYNYQYVIRDSLTTKSFCKKGKPAPWVSVIESGTAKGQRLTLVVIFTGISLQG